MMPCQSYQLWQATRATTAREQHAADARRGELAAAVVVWADRPLAARRGRSAVAPVAFGLACRRELGSEAAGRGLNNRRNSPTS